MFQHVAEGNSGGKKQECELGFIETWLSTYFRAPAGCLTQEGALRNEKKHHEGICPVRTLGVFCLTLRAFGSRWLPD